MLLCFASGKFDDTTPNAVPLSMGTNANWRLGLGIAAMSKVIILEYSRLSTEGVLTGRHPLPGCFVTRISLNESGEDSLLGLLW